MPESYDAADLLAIDSPFVSMERPVFRETGPEQPVEEPIHRLVLEIGPIAASQNLDVSGGYACDFASCTRTKLKNQSAKQFFNSLLANRLPQ